MRGKPAVVRVMVDGTWEIAHRFGWTSDNIVDYQRSGRGWKVGLARFLQRRWWSWSARIIPVSDFLKGIVLGYGTDPKKVTRIYNAYNGPKLVTISKADARVSLGLPTDAKILLTICRLMIWKGVDGILRALATLPPDRHLVVCGDGEELRQLAFARARSRRGVARPLGGERPARQDRQLYLRRRCLRPQLQL